jgi:mono/diheme cytochrome c family protein
MKKLFLFGIIAATTASMTFSSCYKKNIEETYGCDTSVTTYASVIKPIVGDNCAKGGCHSATDKAGGYDLSSYDGLHNIAISAKLVGSIKQDGSAHAMPPSGKLDDCSIAKITRWVNRGAQNN